MQTGSTILRIPLLCVLATLAALHVGNLSEAAEPGGIDALPAMTPLHLAAQAGNLSQAKRLIDSGEQVESRDDREMTPLHYAAIGGYIDIASILLDRGADPNARALVGMTPLHFAAMIGRAEMTGLLTRRGARTDVRNETGMTPLHLAADDKVVTTLLGAGAAVGARTDSGLTPLHTARMSSVARALLDGGADLRVRTPQGRTAMELAAVESLEPAGLSIHSVMLGRLRGLLGQMNVTLTNISAQPITRLTFAARSPACDVEVEPAAVAQLSPGQNAKISLTLTRNPTAKEGEHPIFISVAAAGKQLGAVDLRVDTRTGQTLEDKGMIRLAKGQMRPATSRWFYLVYGSVPLLVVAAWFLLRRR